MTISYHFLSSFFPKKYDFLDLYDEDLGLFMSLMIFLGSFWFIYFFYEKG